MPYIKVEDRVKYQETLEFLPVISTAGEFNFLITKLMKQYVKDHGESYQTYNDLMGALEGAKLEVYRRSIAPYENLKIDSNGDV